MRITLESHFAYMDGDDDMKVLVITDIHLKTWIFDRAEEIFDAILEGKDVLAIMLTGAIRARLKKHRLIE